MLKLIGAVTCVAFGALVLFVLFVAGSHTNSSASSGGADTTALGPAMRISAMKLALDYHANEVQADNVYRGKHLLVTGLVTSISKDAFDNVYLALASENEFMPVHANLKASEAGAAANLHTMQLVNVDCVGGEMLIGSPQLNDCAIVQGEEPANAPVVPNEPAMGSQPSSSDVTSGPSPSEPTISEGVGSNKDSAGADASSGDVQEGQAPPQQTQEQQPPQQPPAPIERH